MPKIPYLVQRRKGYYIRVRVPKDLIEIYGPHQTRSLKTSDFNVAKKQVSIAKVKLDAEFDRKRREFNTINNKIDTDQLSYMSESELMALLNAWLETDDTQDRDAVIFDKNEISEEEKEIYLIELKSEHGFHQSALEDNDLRYGIIPM